MVSEVDKLGRTIGNNTTETQNNANRMSNPGTLHTRFNLNKYKVQVRNTKTEIRSVPIGNWFVWDQTKWDEAYWADDDYTVTDALTSTTYRNTAKTTATWDGSGTITF